MLNNTGNTASKETLLLVLRKKSGSQPFARLSKREGGTVAQELDLDLKGIRNVFPIFTKLFVVDNLNRLFLLDVKK